MSDAKRETTTGKKRARDGQEATATVELAILLPVYMLMFVGVMTIGHLVLIRQKVVEAVRFQAWLPDDPATNSNQRITDNFFSTYQSFSNGPGYAQTAMNRSAFTFDENGFFQGCYATQNASQVQRQLAIDVLNDSPSNDQQGNNRARRHLEIVHVEGKFTYRPDWMQTFIRAAITEPKTQCTVLVRSVNQAAERKSLRQEGTNGRTWVVDNHDPIEDYYAQGTSSFPISRENGEDGTNRPVINPTDRFYTPGAPDRNSVAEQGKTLDPPIDANRGNPDPGIWNTNYRLGGVGAVDTERSLYRRILFGR